MFPGPKPGGLPFFLVPDKVADGGGHSPQTISGSTCFLDKVPQRSTSPSIEWLSRRELHSRPLPFAGKRSCLLSYGKMVETVRVALTTACLQDRLASTEHASPKMAPSLRLSRRPSTLEASRSVLSYEGIKWTTASGSHRANVGLQPTGFNSSARGRKMRRPGNAPGWSDARLFYRQPRLFTELSPR